MEKKMEQKQRQEQKIAIKTQKGIRQAEDQLVTLIQNALDKKQTYGNLEESQFRNLLRVADTTDSPEVVKNFLLYQTGRDNKWGSGKESLAKTIVADIGAEGKDGIILNLAKTIAQEAGSSDIKGIWVELIRRYLGYGSRYLKYLRDGDKK